MSILDRIIPKKTATEAKAVVGPAGGGWGYGPLLTALNGSPQAKAATALRAYPVGWFYKAESRISRDVSDLDYELKVEDPVTGAETKIEPASSLVPFAALDPLQQFLRLWEKPNAWQTGHQLKAKTQIRLDMAGTAFIYLENGANGGFPTALYGISPSRMTPSMSPDGRVIGWVMDRDQNGKGIPFTADEIMVLAYGSADDSPWGVGVVESVFGEIPINEAITRHIGDVLATGGRLAGMAWPKDRALDEREFLDAQRAWRNVTSDPNAARRLLLFPEPMEYVKGAASPMEIGIPELANLHRDTVLTAFPIPPFMVGVPLESGLNSGDSLRYVMREYWQGTIHPRTEIWEDAIQQVWIPRLERWAGQPLDFDIEEPNLDDAKSINEKADAMTKLVALGFDPIGAAKAVELDDIPMLPPAAPVAAVEMVDDEDLDFDETPLIAVRSRKAAPRRDDAIGQVLPGFRTAVRDALEDQRKRLIDGVTAELSERGLKGRKAVPMGWWDQDREDQLMGEALRPLYARLSREALGIVAAQVGRTVLPETIAAIDAAVASRIGVRITQINHTTRDAVAEAIAEGMRRGYSIMQLTNGVTDENFRGLVNLPAFDEARAELVSRTETMFAYNETAIRGYGEFGVTELQALDGDFDEVCKERDGKVFSVEEALAETEAEHPNGTLDWAPLLPEGGFVLPDEGKAVDLAAPRFMRDAARRGLELLEFAGDGLTEKTRREARAMADGTVTADKWTRIAAWMSRHRVDLEGAPEPGAGGRYTPGQVAHLLWGAEPTLAGNRRTRLYAERKVRQIVADNEEPEMKAHEVEALLERKLAGLREQPSAKSTVVYQQPELPVPTVNVAPPEVTVQPTPVTIDTTAFAEALKAQNEALVAHGAAILNLAEQLAELKRPTDRQVVRDERGAIIRIEEVRRGA